MKKYIGAVLSIATIGLLFYTLFDLKKQIAQLPVLKNEIDSVTIIKDSLVNEVFIHEVQNGRYQSSLYYLEEVNPKAASQFKNYLEHSTE
jgi:hypothetical protein